MFGLFFQLAPVATEATAGTPAALTSGGGLMSFLPLILMLLVMYLLVFLPDSKRRKKLQKQISELKQGDRVATAGGIVGSIDFIGEKTIYIKSIDSKLEISKASIAVVLEPGKAE